MYDTQSREPILNTIVHTQYTHRSIVLQLLLFSFAVFSEVFTLSRKIRNFDWRAGSFWKSLKNQQQNDSSKGFTKYHQSTLLSVRPSVCPSVRLSVRPSVHASLHMSVRSSMRPSTCPFVRPSISVRSTHPSIHPSIHPREPYLSMFNKPVIQYC